MESRAAARRLLEAREPLETLIYQDEDGWPIFEPGVRYDEALFEVPVSMKPREHETFKQQDARRREEWLAGQNKACEAGDRKIQIAVWAERHGFPERGLSTLPPELECVQREKQRACREAFLRCKKNGSFGSFEGFPLGLEP